jgi:hypothetical protein
MAGHTAKVGKHTHCCDSSAADKVDSAISESGSDIQPHDVPGAIASHATLSDMPGMCT